MARKTSVVLVRKVRESLDGARLDLVDCQEVEPMIRLRIDQAIRRSGLHDLLSPVLQDLDRMHKGIKSAEVQIRSADAQLSGKQ